MSRIEVNDVVRFNKDHEFKGCLGIVENIEKHGRNKVYQIMIPMPNCGNGDGECGGYRVTATKEEIVRIGKMEVD